jgi:hypothetical protein
MPKAKNERNDKVPCYAPDINTIVQIHFIQYKEGMSESKVCDNYECNYADC